MHDPPGTIPSRVAKVNSRRVPANQSVSLRHSPPATGRGPRIQLDKQPTTLSSPNTASDKANPPSSVSPRLALNKYSSGESSDAGKWFETTNNNAQQYNASYTDNDPPFFLRNSSSADTPPEASHGLTQPGLAYRPNLMHVGTDASSTEDFRSVIDDLTVANKKLRQKLKKYEKLHDEHLQGEKLFEVRFHGLPDHKKKELEETLRKFASELDDGAPTGYPQISSQPPALEHQNTASSISRFAESGYVSMPVSAPNSSARSNPTSTQEKDRRKMTKAQYHRQQQTIQSYLHDIPSGLLPQNKAPMTDKSKKKLVVRRLEQIFAGKRSAPGAHQQPMQQEEVAQSAATADRQEREATGKGYRPEGSREAHIMPRGQHEPFIGEGEAIQGFNPHLHIGEQDFAGSGSSPDQRPTRPLDLDPYRAQVSTDNMQYIRHLGFTPPDMVSGEGPTEGHGWLYLNLLINMAQLHTLNVTPEFIKDALEDYSSHLEISRDGRKVRWTGGLDVTRNSGSSSSEHYSGASPYYNTIGAGSPLKRIETGTTGTSSDPAAESEQRTLEIQRQKRLKERNKFAYKPIFFHEKDSEDEDDFHGASPNDSLPQQRLAGNSSGMGSSAMQSYTSKPRREDGPMIFYTKAKFCTDLSGDRLGTSLANPGSYKVLTSHPLGASTFSTSSNQRPMLYRTSTITEPRGPLDSTQMDTDSNAGSGITSSVGGFGFSPEDLKRDSGNDSPEVMDFEASGLGGVHPDDNFSIHVRRSQVSVQPPQTKGRRASHHYSQRILNVLSEQPIDEIREPSPRSSPQRVIKEELLSATRRSMPSSALPPASFLPFDSTSSGDVDSDLDSDASSEPDADVGDGVPLTAPQLLAMSTLGDGSSAGGESDTESDCTDDSDDSIDLLATARRLDPTTVRASEREYDAALAERLAEEIPAGSSAATAGGGSGFNTPEGQKGAAAAAASAANVAAYNNLKSPSNASSSSQTRSLKRLRTSDSIATMHRTGSKGTKSRKTR